jgi:hypothetical protein
VAPVLAIPPRFFHLSSLLTFVVDGHLEGYEGGRVPRMGDVRFAGNFARIQNQPRQFFVGERLPFLWRINDGILMVRIAVYETPGNGNDFHTRCLKEVSALQWFVRL